MVYRALADFIVLVHFTFVLFSVFGGFLVFRWKRMIWIHLPAAFWAMLIEVMGWICPLTPLEIWFRQKSGETGYSSGFIEHYLLFFIYPASLTRTIQIVLGILVLAVNAGIYGWLLKLRTRFRQS